MIRRRKPAGWLAPFSMGSGGWARMSKPTRRRKGGSVRRRHPRSKRTGRFLRK